MAESPYNGLPRRVAVADILHRDRVNDVFGDVLGLIANAFEATGNEDQLEKAPNVVGILGHHFCDAVRELSVQLIEFLVTPFDSAGKLYVVVGV